MLKKQPKKPNKKIKIIGKITLKKRLEIVFFPKKNSTNNVVVCIKKFNLYEGKYSSHNKISIKTFSLLITLFILNIKYNANL